MSGGKVTARSIMAAAHLDSIDELELHDGLHLELVLRHNPAGDTAIRRYAEEVQLLRLVVALPVNLAPAERGKRDRRHGCCIAVSYNPESFSFDFVAPSTKPEQRCMEQLFFSSRRKKEKIK